MAVNLTTLFEDLGAIVKAINTLRDVAADGTSTSIEGLRDNLFTVLNGNSTDAAIPDIARTFDGVADNWVGSLERISDLATVRLLDRETILDELNVTADINRVLPELIREMEAQSASIAESSVTAPNGTADSENIGTGLLYATTTLDGSAPSPGFPANLRYAGLASELAVPETLTVTCQADSDADALPRGHEQFLIQGQTGFRSKWDWKNEGSGVSLLTETDNAHEVMTNRNMEVWTDAGELSGWDSVVGAPGTEFAQESDASYVHGGSSAMKVMDACTFEQAIPPQILFPNRLYRISFWTKAAITSAATVTLSIICPSGIVTIPVGPTKTGLTAGAYALTTGLVLMPANLADDLIFRLSIASVTEDLWIDRVSFAPVRYAGGVGLSIIAGDVAFSREDRFTSDLTTPTVGVFQQFFRRMYGVQLPSDAVPTISDSLAQ